MMDETSVARHSRTLMSSLYEYVLLLLFWMTALDGILCNPMWLTTDIYYHDLCTRTESAK